jgi:regulatory protein
MVNPEKPREEPDELILKLRHFCSFQERCTAEVLDKLHRLGASGKTIPGIVEQLKKENFLNDERYAGAYARGKFRINGWGRIKIRYELARHHVPEEIISQGLKEIGEEEYAETLRELVRKKFNEIKGEKKLTVRNKIFTFVSAKGFESGLISEALKELNI